MKKTLSKLTDEQLGKSLRKYLNSIKKAEIEEPVESIKKGILSFASVMLLLNELEGTNTDRYTYKCKNLTLKETFFGDWNVVLEKQGAFEKRKECLGCNHVCVCKNELMYNLDGVCPFYEGAGIVM